LTYNVDLSGGL